ncbi:MAG: chromosomal replication initiator protein DnaA [Syntrophobacterales bacterium]|nr:chromosomal replication initiator protein DnaA [Syntrophobacterales bacterium]
MLWNKVAKIIKEKITKQNFDTWIMPIQVRSLEEGNLCLNVPNRFFRDWLQENYLFLIREALLSVTGLNYDVEFIIADNPRKNNSPSIKTDESILDNGKTKHKQERVHKTLNSNYSFDRFIVGASNQFAHAAAVAVAEQPAKNYNPLFIYGGVGLGKTHLINAIGLKALQLFPDMNVVYVSAEVFMNDLINCIRFDKMQKFRERFRNIDCLLIDDIQFLAGKDRTQEEFFHTFNTLHDAGKQIVVTSDKFPKDIENLEGRLRSRFEWGLIADIQPPDIETRMAILEKKASENSVVLPGEVSLFLATQSESNIRELEGYLVRVSAYSSLTSRPIDIDLTKEVLKQLLYKTEKKEISIDDITKVVCSQLGVKIQDVKSNKKNKNIAEARQIAMFLAREMTNSSFPDIGEKIGGRDHSTVIYSFNKIKKKLQTDKQLIGVVEKIKKIIIKNN